MQTKIEKLPQSRVRLTVTVPSDVLTDHYHKAVAKLAQHVEVKGFRKGHAPQNLVIEKVGNASVLNEMFDLVIPETYYLAIQEHSELMPVDRPAVDVKELKGLDDDNLIPTEMVYTAEVDVMPEVKAGDYKKIKVKPKKADEKVDNEQLDKTVEELKNLYGDDYLKVGNFTDEAAFRQAVAENIKSQQVIQAESDTYDMIIEELLKKSKVEVPEAFIHNEIHRMERQVEMQARVYGMTFDDWLKRENKTHDDIHVEWRPQAEKAAKVGLVLGKIAEAEGIDPASNEATRLVLERLYELSTGLKKEQPADEAQDKSDKK